MQKTCPQNGESVLWTEDSKDGRLIVEMNRRLAAPDKSLIENILKLPDKETTNRSLGVLQDRVQIAVPLVLVEEALANHVEPKPHKDRPIAEMVQLILDRRDDWLEDPLELVFMELVRGEVVRKQIRLAPERAESLEYSLRNLTTVAVPLAEWEAKRFAEKKERREARNRQKNGYLHLLTEDFRAPLDLAEFANNGIRFLRAVLNRPELGSPVLEGVLAHGLRRRHKECIKEIDLRLSSLNFDQLGCLPFTKGYLLAEVLYDIGRVSKLGPKASAIANPQVLSKSNMNDEEDQQYVASALICDGLVTCDQGMHRVACAIKETGHWHGSSWYVPRDHVDRLEDYLSPIT